MKITKFSHSCLLVEMPQPINRTALFDPGVYSTIDIDKLQFLDDIFITHMHADHMDVQLIAKLRAKFPEVRITAPSDAREQLETAGITGVLTTAPDGVSFFTAPHESIRPLYMTDPPEEQGIHYLERLSHPGDSHHFHETQPVLALPVTAPWGATADAVEVALTLKPKYILPIHDWHWRDEARVQMYDRLAERFGEAGITFLKLEDGIPVVIQEHDLEN